MDYRNALATALTLHELGPAHNGASVLASYALQPRDARVLVEIARRPCRAEKAIAHEANISKPSATRSTRRLSDNGLIRRVPNPYDGRERWHEVTVRGHAALEQLRAAALADLTATFVEATANDVRSAH